MTRGLLSLSLLLAILLLGAAERTRLFALIDLTVGMATLAIQVLATGRFMRRFGIGWALALVVFCVLFLIGFSPLLYHLANPSTDIAYLRDGTIDTIDYTNPDDLEESNEFFLGYRMTALAPDEVIWTRSNSTRAFW